MSYFHVTASNIRLEGNELVANLDNGSGESPEARIDLNTVLGNEDGHFSWGGKNFSASAENICLEIAADGMPILRADLKNSDEALVSANVNLTERLINTFGEFQFQE
ncbi:Cyanovirin-N [Pyronema domesticum]|uniref:Similar to Cyanovirin-N homolog acc. no. Q7S6U4 n=1 Tax=Pyronema omphalodes (strain CBS 100304) TaxID=1076935 RepID=U4L1X6_PYROM|nr:Cyanovirin-N [Pyronema domesticum]CCX10125.1 Similar to Cyanovirin-N homolog; acc. no. Q7S6U4 [Pyronema omphalodes CBS 100304]